MHMRQAVNLSLQQTQCKYIDLAKPKSKAPLLFFFCCFFFVFCFFAGTY